MTDGDIIKLLDASDVPVPVTVKANDYAYDGWVIMGGYKRGGQYRVVVEDDNKRLFVHNAGQLRSR